MNCYDVEFLVTLNKIIFWKTKAYSSQIIYCNKITLVLNDFLHPGHEHETRLETFPPTSCTVAKCLYRLAAPIFFLQILQSVFLFLCLKSSCCLSYKKNELLCIIKINKGIKLFQKNTTAEKTYYHLVSIDEPFIARLTGEIFGREVSKPSKG